MDVTTATDYLPLTWTVTITPGNGDLGNVKADDATTFTASTAKTFTSLAAMKDELPDKGVYRIRVSINDEVADDNAYITFVVIE